MSRIDLRGRALLVAQRYVGVRERTRNSGPEIDQWLELVRLGPGNPWCAAFVYGCYHEAGLELGAPNPLPRTGSVWALWNKADDLWKSDHPSVGAVFIHVTTEHTGHTGLVVDVEGDYLVTVEGNANAEGSREGDGVYLKKRPISYADGFIDVGREGPLGFPG
jgi:hypothetical protein